MSITDQSSNCTGVVGKAECSRSQEEWGYSVLSLVSHHNQQQLIDLLSAWSSDTRTSDCQLIQGVLNSASSFIANVLLVAAADVLTQYCGLRSQLRLRPL